MTSTGWYLRRLSRMGPREISGRAADAVRKRRWRRLLAERPADRAAERPADRAAGRAAWLPRREFTATVSRDALAAVPENAAARLLATADRIMDGYADYFGVTRDDLVSPDWAYDPRTGRRAPADAYAFDIPYRDESAVGDIKQIWEPSRHQHLTVLAAAFALTGDDRYASRVAEHLKSWWAANPPLCGVHWVSGIELGIRLISWVWVRRLLHGWPGAAGLFEDNPEALHQIWHHQRWLAAFPSRGSSANNHVIAEAAGQLAAACAFCWFPESARWRAGAMRTLDEHLRRNTFGSGLNRELATEYHGLVLELGLAAAAEASAAGVAVPSSTWLVLQRMTDALAAILDCRLRPPRQGDADDGHGLILDGTGPGADRWAGLLATGEALFGRLPWWPALPGSDVRTALLAALATPGPPGRPGQPVPSAQPAVVAGPPALVAVPPGVVAVPPGVVAELPGVVAELDRSGVLTAQNPAAVELGAYSGHSQLGAHSGHSELGAHSGHSGHSGHSELGAHRGHSELGAHGGDSGGGNGARNGSRPGHFADAGLTILRCGGGEGGAPEIWCRCDGGPHGFLSIAAHAHADALSVEVRHGGVDVLADPGTYCYHGEPRWRSYFRSTVGHNTLELDGRDQSTSGGPFLWTRHARSRILHAQAPAGGVASWCAEHDGYASGRRPAVHRRTVELDGTARELRVLDEVHGHGQRACRLALHLGPRIGVELTGSLAHLSWTAPDPDTSGNTENTGNTKNTGNTENTTEHTAVLELPAQLSWAAHRGQTDPPLGWYSAGFGHREPASTLLGSGRTGTGVLTTVLRFHT